MGPLRTHNLTEYGSYFLDFDAELHLTIESDNATGSLSRGKHAAFYRIARADLDNVLPPSITEVRYETE